jgi:hypothetical protein
MRVVELRKTVVARYRTLDRRATRLSCKNPQFIYELTGSQVERAHQDNHTSLLGKHGI